MLELVRILPTVCSLLDLVLWLSSGSWWRPGSSSRGTTVAACCGVTDERVDACGAGLSCDDVNPVAAVHFGHAAAGQRYRGGRDQVVPLIVMR